MSNSPGRSELQAPSEASSFLAATKLFRDRWQYFVSEALAGRAAEAHAERDWFFQAVEAAIRAASVEQIAETVGLEQTLAKLRSRWQSADDLEYLAVETLTPSREKLEALVKKYRIPQAWYDDDSEPF